MDDMADWYGVELDQALGRHDGTVQGVRSQTRAVESEFKLKSDFSDFLSDFFRFLDFSRLLDLPIPQL